MIEPFDAVNCSGGPAATTQSAIGASPGTQVQHPVGRLNHGRIVFDDQDAVPLDQQPSQAGDQSRRIAGMKSRRRLIKDRANPHQPRAELSRESSPLQLTSGECVRPPAQAQIIEADLDQVLEPAHDLGDQRSANLLQGRIDSQRPEETQGIADAHVGHIMNRSTINPNRSCLRTQSRPRARSTGNLVQTQLDRVFRMTLISEPLTNGTCPVGTIETETAGLELG